MQRQRAGLFLAGAILFVAGVATALLLPGGEEGSPIRLAAGIVAAVALILGAIGLYGLVAGRKTAGEAVEPAHAGERQSDDLEVRAMLRAMIATASSDGEIDPREIDTIRAVFCQVTGEPFDPLLFARVEAETLSPRYAIAGDLKLKHAPVSADMQRRILRACALVLFADGSMLSREVERLTALGDLFGMDHREVHQMMHAAREDYAEGRITA